MRPSSCRHQHLIDLDAFAVRQGDAERRAGAIDARRQNARLERHAGMRHRRRQRVADVAVEPAQHIVGAEDLRHLRSQPREDAGEFDGDIAAAHHQQALRELRQVEDFVRRDGEIGAGDRRLHDGRAARGDQDVSRRNAAAVRERDGVRSGQRRPRRNRLDAGLFEIGRIDAGEARDFLFLGGDQRRPVEADGRHGPAEPGRILEFVAKAARVDVELLRHAAADHAGAADPEFLGDGDLRAVPRRDARRADAAGAGADDEQVVIVSAQRLPPVAGRVRARGPSSSSLRAHGSSCRPRAAAARPGTTRTGRSGSPAATRRT